LASGGTTISQGGGLADRYAAALYDLAHDDGKLDETVAEMERLGALIRENVSFRLLVTSPLIDIKQALAASRAALESQGYSPIIVRFVAVVASNRRLNQLGAFVTAFAALVARKRGVVTAQVSTAHALAAVQREQLRARLIEAGYGRVNIEEQVDKTLLGGLVLKIGARLYDNSIKSRLQRLQYVLKGA